MSLWLRMISFHKLWKIFVMFMLVQVHLLLKCNSKSKVYYLGNIIKDNRKKKRYFYVLISSFLFSFSGFPKPRIYWFKDGQPLRPSNRILLLTERDVHSVEILEVKKEDMGEYSAYISNAAGSAYSSARLTVLSMYRNYKDILYQVKCV